MFSRTMAHENPISSICMREHLNVILKLGNLDRSVDVELKNFGLDHQVLMMQFFSCLCIVSSCMGRNAEYSAVTSTKVRAKADALTIGITVWGHPS